MIEKLDIVKGGVAKKDLTPVLKHLKIANGWVTATNGRLTIATPIPEVPDLDIIVPADKFILAIKSCKQPKFKVVTNETNGVQRLSITGKKFRALLPLMVDVTFPSPEIVGDNVQSNDLLSAIKKIAGFVGEDASRPWACGILLYQNMAYATNNTLLVETPVQWDGPPINLPDFAIEELLRLKRDIRQIKTNGQNITFELEDNIWINSSVLSTNWPNVKNMFDKVDFSNVQELDPELLPAIQYLIPFCPDKKFPRIHFSESGVSTDPGSHEASTEFEGLPESIWRAEPLLQMLDRIKSQAISSDFSQWPKACPWVREDGVKGLIIGLRK